MGSPWQGICCEACWTAKEEKCVCKCEGLYHGRGLQQEPTKEEYEKAGLTINPEYEALLPKLPFLEYEALKTSIQNEGLHYPIIVNFERVILDGHHRARACLELGIKPEIQVKTFSHPLFEKKFVIESNLRRRHLNDFRKAELIYPLEEIEQELAKDRQGMRTDLTSSSNELNVEFGQARDIVASKVGLSPTTYFRAKKIIEGASEEDKDRLRNNEVKISTVYNNLKEDPHGNESLELPEGSYEIIYADPPWKYKNKSDSLRGVAESYYETMNVKDICELAIPSCDDAVLFLWTTNPMLEDAFQVMQSWGFRYKTNMVWVKNRMGVGFYFRGQHEILLVAVKGKVSAPLKENRFPSVLFSPLRAHSQKPDEVYELIEKMYPDSNRIELFARNHREGWEAWGNEV